ncbi:MAG TPA: hypothetical protein VKX96_02345 [Chloroflexota bacterium]|nr:hypothetical protein [Chloroflexota bacterium]
MGLPVRVKRGVLEEVFGRLGRHQLVDVVERIVPHPDVFEVLRPAVVIGTARGEDVRN